MKWDQNNPEKVKDFIAKMKQDYAFKSETRQAYTHWGAWRLRKWKAHGKRLQNC